LGVFLAVVGSLFALFISAYSMRMNMVDWRALPVPRLLWFNTGVLVMSSIALQWAHMAARSGLAVRVDAAGGVYRPGSAGTSTGPDDKLICRADTSQSHFTRQACRT
jgi:hypothetical protein